MEVRGLAEVSSLIHYMRMRTEHRQQAWHKFLYPLSYLASLCLFPLNFREEILLSYNLFLPPLPSYKVSEIYRHTNNSYFTHLRIPLYKATLLLPTNTISSNFGSILEENIVFVKAQLT